ncbi:KTSC domain-containing protein [Nonomuraea bangladeshensis]|uniref:KTSC domain-containing protein n=1 Tax=Nonomuraea bangladeshensis TaxID=404385 RepID=UPI0031D4C16B
MLHRGPVEVDRKNVVSSNLDSVGYDALTQTLEIRFKNGSIYQYADVPLHVHLELMNAPSKGQFLARTIKGVYRYRRVPG